MGDYYLSGGVMFTYLIMRTPGFNRVYYEESLKMAMGELTIATERFQNRVLNIEEKILGDIDYIACTLDGAITDGEIELLSRLSFIFALFQLVEIDQQHCLMPLKKVQKHVLDPKISSLLKYPGKTNELFTKMMLNIALLVSDFQYDDRIKLLDPVAGRGTTLFEGAIHGFHGYGIELNKKSVHEGVIFFKKYLERERHKHSYTTNKTGGKGKKEQVLLETFEYTGEKRLLRLINGDTTKADQYLKNNSIHLIVGDLPYGIAHGNVGKGQKSRTPLALLEDALPGWKKVLKPGGAVVLGWNIRVYPMTEMRKLFRENGFTVFDESPFDQFEHRVDQSIQRDIVVAKLI